MQLNDGSSSDWHGDHIRPDDCLQPPYSGSPGRVQTRPLSLDAGTEQVSKFQVNAEVMPVTTAPQLAPMAPKTTAASAVLSKSHGVKKPLSRYSL